MAKEIRIPFTDIYMGRFLLLLISMILIFVLRPFLEGFVRINFLMDIFFTLMLFSGIYAVSEKKGIFLTGLLIAFPAFLGSWAHYFLETPATRLLGSTFLFIFLLFAALVILRYLFTEKEVTKDVIIGAVCVYFLIGFAWGIFFMLMEHFHPGSFKIHQDPVEKGAWFVYYSFVTLTTLGYGDITPLSGPARSLAVLEAVTGQLYLAVLIARLVGIHISQAAGDHSKRGG